MAFTVLVGSATLVAVMVTDWAALMVDGAVYIPFKRFPTIGFMDQVTDVFAVPVTVAVNCLACEGYRLALGGVMLMLTLSAAS